MHKLPEGSFARLFPGPNSALASELAEIGGQEILASRHLDRLSYTTASYLNGSESPSTQDLRCFPLLKNVALSCETSSDTVRRYCAEHGLELSDDLSMIKALPTLAAALRNVICPIPFLRDAIHVLTWRCHVVRAPEDSYDVSFSDPEVPFSVFVSVPSASKRSSVLRVAENLVHETMHLMLTLFECNEPLIKPGSISAMYSPWKQELRPAQGILHGLYVFAILRWMWQHIALSPASEEDRIFAQKRVCEIDAEVSAVEALLASPALTIVGRAFVAELLRFAKQDSSSAETLPLPPPHDSLA